MYINLKQLIEELRPKNINKNVVLGILKHGEHEDSTNYIFNIEMEAEQLGVKTIVQDLEHTYISMSLLQSVSNFIIPVKPFPELLEKLIKVEINPNTDVDNFSGKSFYNNCTAEAVLEILEYLNVSTDKYVLVVGRHIGLEIFKLLLERDYTVGIAHSKTKNLKKITMNSDVIISCTGVQGLIKKDMVKANSLVIDVGLGDVEEDVARKAHVTPVRNGVGAVTTQILFKHILEQ